MKMNWSITRLIRLSKMFTEGVGLAGVFVDPDSTMVAGMLSEDEGGLITIIDALLPLKSPAQVGS